MKYTIVTLFSGKAGEYQQNLLYSIAERFYTKKGIKTKPPAHVTLKYSFNTENINIVEEYIKRFCETHKKCNYQLNNINRFSNKAIFIDVFPSEEMKKMYVDFIKYLKKNTNIYFRELDGRVHFHSTLAYNDIGDKFEEMWLEVSKEKPDFRVVLDNITILKFEDEIWKVHKEFYLSE